MNTYTQLSMTFADEPSFALLPSTMSYDFVTGDIYGVFYNADLTGQNWVRYNTLTLEPEIICPFNGRFNVVAMGTAADGKIYVINTDGDLYTVNRANSRVSLVGSTGGERGCIHTGDGVGLGEQHVPVDCRDNKRLGALLSQPRRAFC